VEKIVLVIGLVGLDRCGSTIAAQHTMVMDTYAECEQMMDEVLELPFVTFASCKRNRSQQQ